MDLIGEHAVYNSELISPATLSFGIYLLLSKNNERYVKFWSLNEPEAINFEINKLQQRPVNSWVKYPLIVFNRLIDSGIELSNGYDMLFWGNIPDGVDLLPDEGFCILFGENDVKWQCKRSGENNKIQL